MKRVGLDKTLKPMQVCKTCTSSTASVHCISSKVNSEFYSRYMQMKARGSSKCKGMQGHASSMSHRQYEGAARLAASGAEAKHSSSSHHSRSISCIQTPSPSALSPLNYYRGFLTLLEELDHIVSVQQLLRAVKSLLQSELSKSPGFSWDASMQGLAHCQVIGDGQVQRFELI